MPYDCGVERGRVWVAPSTERSFEIIGQREEQSVTVCNPMLSAECRTIMVHRFAVSCGGNAIAWMRIAGAIRQGAAARAWVDDGRVNLVLSPRGAPVLAAECLEAHARGAAGQRRECLPWRRNAGLEHMVLPAGFAPVGELGAHLLLGSTADEAAAGLHGGELTLAKADPDAILEPSAAVRTFDAALEPELATDDWITVVRAEDGYAAAVVPVHFGAMSPWAWLLATLLAATAAVVARLRASAILPRLFARAARPEINPALVVVDPTIANAAASVAAMLRQTEAAASSIKGAGALRDVLHAETALVRQRLANVEQQLLKGEMPVAKSAPQFRNFVRELERIRRIADSAVASLSGGRGTPVLPGTTSEAYEVLGVNAEVSDGVLKKIVDALRMSWHPDHARDDDDRLMREDRIRQINIAWDLINGKREAA
jgi:hypothetical protein